MLKRTIQKSAGAVAAAILATMSMGLDASAQSAADFYRGKTVRVTNPTGAGGTMDLYILLAMKYMKKYLPKDAEMVLEHRTGAGLLNGTNHVFNAARKDGTAFGMAGTSLVFDTVTTPQGVRYKPTEFIPIGRVVDLPRVFIVRADTGIKSLGDMAKKYKNVTHATMIPGGPLLGAMLLANDAGSAKFRGIPGYFGGGPTFLAVEQGEVLSTSAEPANLLANKWDLVEKGVINVIGQTGRTKVVGLENVPTLLELTPPKHPIREVVEAWADSADVGLTFVFPPGVPADRVAYMRDVLRKAMNDPELAAEVKKRRIPVNYASGQDQAKLIASSLNMSPKVKDWLASTLKRIN